MCCLLPGPKEAPGGGISPEVACIRACHSCNKTKAQFTLPHLPLPHLPELLKLVACFPASPYTGHLSILRGWKLSPTPGP